MVGSSAYNVMLFYSNSNQQSLRARVVINEYASENFHWTDIAIKEIDYEIDRNLARKYGVQGTPAVLIFKNGVLIRRHLGEITSDEIKSIIEGL